MSDSAPVHADDVRPVVPKANPSNWGLYAFIAILLVGGFWLLTTLNAAREQSQATAFPVSDGPARIASPQPLNLPERVSSARSDPAAQVPTAIGPPVSPAPAVPFRDIPNAAILQQTPPEPRARPSPIEPQQPQVVFDRAFRLQQLPANADTASASGVTAARLANPSYTISQGTIIPAVLETAFDSTRPGRVRALVQRDVHSFDGSRVLVPRGSRLFGESEGGLAAGQRRALIQWTRLMRPDGVSIALDSPASDPLGRGGVEGDVDSHFFERLGNGLLNTVLGIGVGAVAAEVAGGSTILALPGSTQNVNSSNSGPQPVLEIDHGTSVSVYVSRDLDFSSVDS